MDIILQTFENAEKEKDLYISCYIFGLQHDRNGHGRK